MHQPTLHPAPHDRARASSGRRPQMLHHLTLALALCSALWLASTPAPCQAADAAPSTAVATALAQFAQASAGQTAAIDPAAEQLRALSAAQPDSPVLRAYAGAATAMQSRTTLLPWKKMSLAEDGLAMIDKALAQLTPAHDAPGLRGVPASLETRFTAASTFLALPAMFNRHERGEQLLAQVLASPLLASAPAAFQSAVAHAEQARQAALNKPKAP